MDHLHIITDQERDKVLANFVRDGMLTALPAREKRKFIIIQYIAGQLEPGRVYSEKELNLVLREIYSDYVTIRRHLVDYGFMERDPDGSRYWIK